MANGAAPVEALGVPPMPTTLSIFCRWPEPGAAKTRLIPEYGAEGAAAIYTKLLVHTVAVARASRLPFELRVTGAPPERFRAQFGGDLCVVEQGEGDLTDRLCRVPAPAIIIGSDCPGLTPELLREAKEALDSETAVVGPACDGGYYLIGVRETASYAFADMPWSTETVFTETMARFEAHGIRPALLPELSDIDMPGDLTEWPDFLP